MAEEIHKVEEQLTEGLGWNVCSQSLRTSSCGLPKLEVCGPEADQPLWPRVCPVEVLVLEIRPLQAGHSGGKWGEARSLPISLSSQGLRSDPFQIMGMRDRHGSRPAGLAG